MVIFNSYVKLPEGICWQQKIRDWPFIQQNLVPTMGLQPIIDM